MNTNLEPRVPLGTTRRKLLQILKQSDGLAVDQLAERLGITPMAVRKHIAALEADGLLESTTVQGPVGRPAHVYFLTPQAEEHFPKQYDRLLTDLLADLACLDGAGKVDLLLARRSERTQQFLAERLDPAASLGERVAALAEGMDELGYLASWEEVEPGVYRIKQYNCAIDQVASCFPGACACEAEMFRRLLGAEVERSSHMLAGDRCCCYVVRAGVEGEQHAG